jgi:hypothetical protein
MRFIEEEDGLFNDSSSYFPLRAKREVSEFLFEEEE